ncbi:MAG: phosphosulfolactate synthase [Halanaerobiales bacterium]
MDKGKESSRTIELRDPIEGRIDKPRKQGLTMIIDKGLGLMELRDLLEVNNQYIDFIKFSFGTALIYPYEIIKRKIEIIKNYQIDVYAGGTLFEIAVTQNSLNDYLFQSRQAGFTAVEISNGTIYLSPKLRKEAIFKARSLGFKVLTEVGKKDRDNNLSLVEMKNQIEFDLSSGTDYIIIEGRESGRAISIYDDKGKIDMDKLNGVLFAVEGLEDRLIWEAPLKSQQAFLINELGPNVSLGNIQPGDAMALEALRRGLRGDTFKYTLKKEFIDNKNVHNKGSIVGA